jgi:hypothetical protein
VARLKVGVAERVITPPVGVPLGGYAGRPGPSVGVHDDLHARALVLEAGGERAALVSLELLYPTPELVKALREEAEGKAGVPADSVLVAAVHTHSGPSVFGLDPCLERSYLDEYWSLLPSLVASVVVEAAGRLAEAGIRFGRGRLDGWTVNRRRPGLGPLDNEVGALLLEGVGGPVAAVVNFACHAVVLGHNNLLISADYPGAVSRAVKRLLGATALFLTGACGDVNPLTPGTSLERVYDRSVGTFADVEEMGTAVACEAVKSLMGSRREEEVELRAVRREVKLSVQQVPEVKLEEVVVGRGGAAPRAGEGGRGSGVAAALQARRGEVGSRSVEEGEGAGARVVSWRPRCKLSGSGAPRSSPCRANRSWRWASRSSRGPQRGSLWSPATRTTRSGTFRQTARSTRAATRPRSPPASSARARRSVSSNPRSKL